jgi:hypothetical protein
MTITQFELLAEFESLGELIEVVAHSDSRADHNAYREMRIKNTSGRYSRVYLRNCHELGSLAFVREIIRDERVYSIGTSLVIGGGGCAVPIFLLRTFQNCSVEVAEACPRVAAAAERYFIRPLVDHPERCKIHVSDGFDCVAMMVSHGRLFDFIFIDAFVGSVPAPIVFDPRFLNLVSTCLDGDGLMLANLGHQDKWRLSTTAGFAAYAASFKGCYRIVQHDGTSIVVARKRLNTGTE